jgi:Mg2+ and Co2+ transporter CorA
MPPPKPSQRRPAPENTPGLSVILVTAGGVANDADFAKVRNLLAADELFWIDLVGADAEARAKWIAELNLDPGDAEWLQRFGQAGRVAFDQWRLRAATWLSEGPGHAPKEIHVLGSQRRMLTAWDGDPAALDGVRERLVETLASSSDSTSAAVAVLLQLVLSTLHHAMSSVDAQLVAHQRQLSEAPASIDFAALKAQVRELQSVWSDVERYSQAVKSAMIGLGALSAVDAGGAEALASYAEQVEDLESRLKERSQWGAEMLRDYDTTIAHIQSLQISRLTMVSIIFLPITFLTGFFGMNFPWMIKGLGGPTAFAVLGLALPALSVAATTLWLLSQHRHIFGRLPQGRPRARRARDWSG